MKKYYIGLFLLLLSCGRAADPGRQGIPETVVLPLKNDRPALLKEKTKRIKRIMLESGTSESAFMDMDKLVVKNDRIYILDFVGTRALYVFGMDGKYQGRIGRMGGGPGEYGRMIRDFDVDSHGHVLLVDNQKKKLHKYTAGNDYIGSVDLPFVIDGFCALDNSDYMVVLPARKGTAEVVVCDSLFRQKRTYFSYAENGDKLDLPAFTRAEKRIVYHRGIQDTVRLFSSEDGTLLKSYLLNFEGKQVPESMKNDYSEFVKIRKETDFRYLYQTPFILGRYMVGNMYAGRHKALFGVDTETGESCVIPLLENAVDGDLPDFPLFVLNDSVLVSYMDYNVFIALENRDAMGEEAIAHLEEGGTILDFWTIVRP